MNADSIADQVLAADEARYQALYAQDANALSPTLHEDYLHTHANGNTDTKNSFLESIRAAKYRFVRAERSVQRVRTAGHAAILSGITKTTIEVGKEMKTMHNAFVTVWVADAGTWKLLHWQATKMPET